MSVSYLPPDQVRYPLLIAAPVLNSALFMKKIEHSRFHDIIYRDIYVIKDDDVPMPSSSFTGFSSENNVENVLIDGLYVNGIRIAGFTEENINTNEYALNITFKRTEITESGLGS